ncbi:hypothetical protein Psfp_00589 [Pelotomaculum sp. FP]|uniref:hypothetical protein n=1 Tax=Pelotomaculum sp. FP TaxID=261474 RepID=UPI001065AB90|nr:hypothetical protein [Pelotomaculum sp. FP]TEB17365.1 hypothetical protein Psfp_00589 [Pelotomaculum sp. FP]
MVYFNLLLIIVIGSVITLLELPGLLQQEKRGELIAFCCFLLIGIALSVAITLKLPVPNPTNGIEFVFRPVTRLFYPE